MTLSVTEAIKPTADSDVTNMYIAIGVGVGAALLVVVTTTVAVAVWCRRVKKNRSKSGTYNIYMDYIQVGLCWFSVPSSSCGDELKILG